MKKQYMALAMEVYKMEIEQMVCDSMKVGGGSINSGTPGLQVGAPEMPDFDNSDELLNFDWQNGLPMF